MTALIVYFPIASAFYDGLRRVDPHWIALARIMQARPHSFLRYILLPAVLLSLISGLKIATAVAPIGAVVGEWVGSSAGLGHLMIHANGRMRVDLVFAALVCLALMGALLYFAISRSLDTLLTKKGYAAIEQS